MPWFQVSADFHSHPRVIGTDPAAIGLWVTAGSWLAGHDSGEFVPRAVAEFLGTPETAAELVRVGLWRRAKGGYRMFRYVSPMRGFPVDHRPLWGVQRDDYRRKIPDRLRAFVFERDGYRCSECASTEDLTLDHIHPWSLGGQDTADNLRILCRPCNSSKGARI